MTFLAWEHGAIVRVPTAWSAWRIGDVACERSSNGWIVAFVGGKWRVVESWQVFEDAEQPKELSA